MVSARSLRSPLTWTVAGLGVLDIGFAVILSAYAVGLTSGALHTGRPHGGIAQRHVVLLGARQVLEQVAELVGRDDSDVDAQPRVGAELDSGRARLAGAFDQRQLCGRG